MHTKRIEEMGQYIVRRLHPEEPNKHSRLWIYKEIKDILVSDQGTNEAVRCIKIMKTSKLNPEIVMKGLGNIEKLRGCLVRGIGWNSMELECPNPLTKFQSLVWFT
ncbi:hypothetical protein L6452_28800 [Arctium lappa]|uniref:Uncharacterized protein n=1 Tax=Arctium lappa TaxID=4217 RepID=A0ACB9A0I2_ARCLA|nr:hypothetical protein L6452_28800 [Arctium lappa]